MTSRRRHSRRRRISRTTFRYAATPFIPEALKLIPLGNIYQSIIQPELDKAQALLFKKKASHNLHVMRLLICILIPKLQEDVKSVTEDVQAQAQETAQDAQKAAQETINDVQASAQ